jgi:hypothetical protein
MVADWKGRTAGRQTDSRTNAPSTCLSQPTWWAALIAATSLATTLPIGPAEAELAYCVRPVPIVAADTTADLARGLDSSEPIPEAPEYLQASSGARYPLAYHYHAAKGPDGSKLNHNVYWSFSDNYELVGPRDMLGAQSTIAVGRSGRSMLIGGSYEKAQPGRPIWTETLLQQDDGGIIGKVHPGLEAEFGDARFVAWSDILDGFVLSAIKWREQHVPGRNKDPQTSSYVVGGDSGTLLLKKDQITKLSGVEGYLDLATDLPGLGVTALLGGRSLGFVTSQLQATQIARLNPGDDWGGFEDLYETRDRGWLYVVGGQYDNAVHVEQVDGQWRATSIVQIAEGGNGSILDWIVGRLIGAPDNRMRRDKLLKIITAGNCRRFSTAAKRMFYCGDSDTTADVRQELRAGEIVPIANGAVALTRFLGDANSLGLALFLGADHGLYGYDGEHVHRVADADFDHAMVHDLTPLGRTLLSSTNKLFEVRAKGDGYELVTLAGPLSHDFSGAPFRASPDGKAVLAFIQSGVYLLKNDGLALIWSSREGDSIDGYGGAPPTFIPGWGGMLFATHPGTDIHNLQFHLLRPCAAS